jgi:hypothetical protein
MSAWRTLIDELDRWTETGATADFWWRDDDAIAHTPQLDLLLKHAGSIPLALAVIPGLATSDLADRLRDVSSAVVLQHGWRHANHATTGRNEYPSSRTERDVSQELAEGRRADAGQRKASPPNRPSKSKPCSRPAPSRPGFRDFRNCAIFSVIIAL